MSGRKIYNNPFRRGTYIYKTYWRSTDIIYNVQQIITTITNNTIMGCAAGKKKVYVFEVQESKEGHGQDTYDMCKQCLKFDDDMINKFYKLFKKIDIKETETIQIDEFYKYLKTDIRI